MLESEEDGAEQQVTQLGTQHTLEEVALPPQDDAVALVSAAVTGTQDVAAEVATAGRPVAAQASAVEPPLTVAEDESMTSPLLMGPPGTYALRRPAEWTAEGQASATATAATSHPPGIRSVPGRAALQPPSWLNPAVASAPPADLLDAARIDAPAVVAQADPLSVSVPVRPDLVATVATAATAATTTLSAVTAAVAVTTPMRQAETYVEPEPMTAEELGALYHNPQLASAAAARDEFMRGGMREQHPLFRLLAQYRRARANVAMTTEAIQAMKGNIEELGASVWHILRREESQTKKCACGNKVTATRSYEVAELDSQASARFRRGR